MVQALRMPCRSGWRRQSVLLQKPREPFILPTPLLLKLPGICWQYLPGYTPPLCVCQGMLVLSGIAGMEVGLQGWGWGCRDGGGWGGWRTDEPALRGQGVSLTVMHVTLHMFFYRHRLGSIAECISAIT